ncbi:glycosyltransferase family 61 protein [Pimelobacter simplex]|uniref:glycosyltransferase family 61 protein n=1 Tax=Nocardioides simplex TaxID=2045 RepID=UPI00215013AE|nr:glycosyltransferase family 61 protein [Pimelobacter simplex]UUW89640.1 glycosyltransferase family 61 protein [Pimelobacter simplex]UUW93469.1 glycosyltransferase family 61 protein [Pimelobacter simplex]
MHVFDASVAADDRRAELASAGRYDVLVVEAPGREWPSWLAELIFHLRPGGSLVFRGERGRRSEPLEKRLKALDEIRDGRRDPRVTGRRGDDIRALARAISSWTAQGPHVVVVNGVTAFAKVRERQVDELFRSPGYPHGSVIASVPAAHFVARCTVVQNESAVRKAEVREISAPEMVLRGYDDVVCLPRQVVVQGNLLLPDTFRRPHSRRMRSAALNELSPGFAELRGDAHGAEYLAGTYVHLDSEFPGHYGHLVTEQLSRMWAWPEIRNEVQRPRVLLSTRDSRTALHAHERELLGAFGVPEEDVLLFHRPLRVERLLSASPMMAQPGWIHPEIAGAWRSAGAALAAIAGDASYPRRIFCGRRTGKRACRNADEVEALFVDEGFTVVYPENYSLPEQAALFRGAEVVAGFAGAAMFNLCYTATPKDVVLLVSESYTAENEYLMAAVQGHRLTLMWCPSDVPLPAKGFSAEAYQASFSADLAKDGAWLRSRLRAIGR